MKRIVTGTNDSCPLTGALEYAKVDKYTRQTLASMGITRMEDFKAFEEHQFLSQPGIGPKRFSQVTALMEAFNLRWKKPDPMNRPGWDEYFTRIASVVATRSHDEQTQVGCVVVDRDRRIRATGYNGFPPGFPDDALPKTRPEKYPFMVHAELNAIASSNQSLKRCTLYCTHSPCGNCVKAIITTGIERVVFRTAYTDWEESRKLLDLGRLEYYMISD